ncbi:MAG: ribosomal RNA small subunit methyltransferase A, partial [Desulfamplus sp.]|nr:ribosomal RNA small subunit methyltransferase A [Desulfamplus sp.]
DYSRISIMLQYCADVKIIEELKAELFFPKPKVDSSVLEMIFHENPVYKVCDEDLFFQIVKASFSQRRKTLRNCLISSWLNLDKKMLEKIQEKTGIDFSRRAETLSIDEYVILTNTIKIC